MIAAIAAAAIATQAFEARILWVDATANLNWTLEPAKVKEFCENAKSSGFNELIVDVKPINGKILFAGEAGERFQSIRNISVPQNYDLLQEFITAGHRSGLRITAGFNVFSEGHSYFPGVGLAYQRREWQSRVAVPKYHLVLKDGKRIPLFLDAKRQLNPGEAKLGAEGVPIPGTNLFAEIALENAAPILRLDGQTQLAPLTEGYPEMVAVFVDPLAEGVRERIFSLVRRLAKYDVDGIAFDRMRFGGFYAGMGYAMREEFERRYGTVSFWPEDVFRANPIPGQPLLRGPRFPEWMQFRAEVIQEFLRDIRKVIAEVNPKLPVGSYVGAGWETYYEVGVNYAQDVPANPYPWAYDEYGLAGYAGYLDYLMTGVFYRVAMSVDPGVAPGRERFTVEGGSELMVKLAGESTLVYPALYGLDWEGNEEGLRSALRAARANGAGLMFFDASYIVKNNWWPIFKEEFAGAPETPAHALPSYPRRTIKKG